MTEKDMDEVLRLLKMIDYRLTSIQFKNSAYEAISTLKDDSKVFNEAVSNIVLLVIDLYIVYLGYKYLTSTNAILQPVAVIGVIGIASVISNSVFTTSKNIYFIRIPRSSLRGWS